jgi:cytoskeletal protein RodZ
MRTRLRLGAAAAVGLGVLLLATVLASPALAWHSNVTVTARCLEGQVRVHYTVAAWEKDHEATVDVSYELNGKVTKLESDDHFFAPKHNQFSDHFDLPAGTTGTITFTAVAHWKDAEPSSDTGSADLPPASKCEESTTTTTEAPTTTTVEETTTTLEATTTTETEATVAPSSTLAETTTTETAVGAATSTTGGGGALPFTGASSGPMLLAGVVLIGGGALVLFVGRNRSQTR